MKKNIGRYFTAKLPAKPYIVKYVSKIYGDPVPVSIKNELGLVVKLCLDKNIYQDHKISDSFIHKHYTSNISFSLSQYDFDRSGFSISPGRTHLINVFLERMFETHLYQYCHAGTNAGKKIKVCLEEFADEYEIITDCDAGEILDISFDGLKKMEMRFRKSDIGHHQEYDLLFKNLKRKHDRKAGHIKAKAS